MAKSDITDELLVALADGELPENEASELYARVLEDESALAKFASFAETGALLRSLAPASENETVGDNVVNLTTKPVPLVRGFQVRDAFQIAAALLVGVIAGPVAFTQISSYQDNPLQELAGLSQDTQVSLRESYQTRGSDNRPMELGIKTLKGEGLTFAGGDFDFSQPFKLVLLSPIAGKATIVEILKENEQDVWLSEAQVEAGQIVEYPSGDDYYSLTSRTEILNLKVQVTNDSQKYTRVFAFSNE